MSPIIGLSDRGEAFPQIGQIRKGAKKEPNKPGADLTYFRVEFDEAETKAAAEFKEIYKEHYSKIGGPIWIRIIMPFDEITRMWDPWYEAYTAGRMVARSDGKFIHYQENQKGDILVNYGVDSSGNRVPHPADGIAGMDYQGKPVKFKATGRLRVIVPELARAAYLVAMTTSINDVGNISDQLLAIKSLNGGRLKGIPLILRRRPKMISTPSGENGQRVRRKKSLISIEADPEWVKAKLGELHRFALPDEAEDALLLPAENVEFENEPLELDEDDTATETEIQLFAPAKDDAMTTAAMKAWNLSKRDAMTQLAKLSPMTREEFAEWLASKS